MFELPSLPYKPRDHGYWDPQTATITWCEEKYYATHYIAEFVNSLTNLMFIGLAIRGLRNCLKHGHDTVFLVTFSGYMIVGLGSFCFHSTLKYPMQLVDELSMIYTTCLMCHATLSYRQSKIFSIILGISLVLLSIFITLYYHYLQDPKFHQTAYGILTAIVLFRSMYMMEVHLRPSLREHKLAFQNKIDRPITRQSSTLDRRDKRILKDMWILVACGLTIFLGGVGIWTVDRVYCKSLKQWRNEIGLPWGVVAEGHGWWHLMTGVGAYFYIVWGIWLRHSLNGRQDEYKLQWPTIPHTTAMQRR